MKLPRMVPVAQDLVRDRVEDVEGALRASLDANGALSRVKPGERIAVTSGSRGIRNLPLITRLVVEALKTRGAEPFIVPAMGSHAGATSEGQKSLLRELGISEETVGAPILATMETLVVGETPAGMPVYLDRNAYEADGIVPVNRVKLHTAMRGDLASGLCKILAVGLGKREGAHRYHVHALDDSIPAAARVMLDTGRVRFGVAILENGVHQTHSVHVLLPETLIEGERRLFALSRTLFPRIPLPAFDVLVVQEMGKNISGTGMDPNVIGIGRRLGGPSDPEIDRVAVLSLTAETHGNATGIGLADLAAQRLVDQMDRRVTYMNSMTSRFPGSAKIPVTLPTDRDVFMAAFDTCHSLDPTLVIVRNTLTLDRFHASENLAPALAKNPRVRVTGPAVDIAFDEGGNFLAPRI